MNRGSVKKQQPPVVERKCVYVVYGTTGEYSDRQEWTVKAFVNEERAKRFAGACQDEVTRLKALYGDELRWNKADIHKYDPQFKWDYTGTDYWVDEIELDADNDPDIKTCMDYATEVLG